jgi:hypothetical protein
LIRLPRIAPDLSKYLRKLALALKRLTKGGGLPEDDHQLRLTTRLPCISSLQGNQEWVDALIVSDNLI